MISAKYTVVLKTLLDDENVKPLIDKAMSTYPIYKPINPTVYSLIPTREELNKKILNYYKYREIGFETVGRFLDELEISLNEIMTYYNQLYKGADILNGVDDPFGNVDITETFEEQTSGTSRGSSEGNSNISSNSNTTSEMNDTNKSVKTTTPQDNINIPAEDIENINYADDVNWSKNGSSSVGTTSDTSSTTNSGNSTAESSGTTTHTLTKKGNQGVNTYAHDLKELMELFNNIEQQIINDKRIQELFMMIY